MAKTKAKTKKENVFRCDSSTGSDPDFTQSFSFWVRYAVKFRKVEGIGENYPKIRRILAVEKWGN